MQKYKIGICPPYKYNPTKIKEPSTCKKENYIQKNTHTSKEATLAY
jgi:hypothetical protein